MIQLVFVGFFVFLCTLFILFRSHSSIPLASVQSGGTAQDPEQSLTEYIRHLEKVQQRLVGAKQGE